MKTFTLNNFDLFFCCATFVFEKVKSNAKRLLTLTNHIYLSIIINSKVKGIESVLPCSSLFCKSTNIIKHIVQTLSLTIYTTNISQFQNVRFNLISKRLKLKIDFINCAKQRALDCCLSKNIGLEVLVNIWK